MFHWFLVTLKRKNIGRLPLLISGTDCKNNNFDAKIGQSGMNFKNDKPFEGPHSVVVEY